VPTDEKTRLRIRQYLIELMDEGAADAMMESMPPIPWTDLATKEDLADLRGDMTRLETGLRRDMAGLETNLRTEITALESNLRTEIGALESNLRTEIGALESNLRTEFTALAINVHTEISGLESGFGHEMVGLEGRLSKQIAESTRMVVFSMMFLMVGVIGAVAAFVNLG
jgi:hypothetical protein